MNKTFILCLGLFLSFIFINLIIYGVITYLYAKEKSKKEKERDAKLIDLSDYPVVNPYEDVRGYAPFEIDLVDIAYSYTVGNRDMAYEIGQAIYEYLKKIEPKIDPWYEQRARRNQ